MSRLSREWRKDWHTSLSMAPGPQRVETGDHDPNFVQSPIGFAPAAPIGDVQKCPADEVEPLLWDGDQA